MLSVYMVREIVARQKQGQAVRMIARDLRVDRRTVKRWLKLGKWEARQQRPRPRQIDQYKSFIERHGPKVLWNARALHRALTGAGFTGSYGQVQRFVRSTPWCYTRWARAAKLRFGSLTQQVAFEWMRAVLQKEIKSDALQREIGYIPDLDVLLRHLYDGRLSQRNRSMVILAGRRSLSNRQISSFLAVSKRTCERYRRLFETGGSAALFARRVRSTRKVEDDSLKKAVFSLLHEPPSNHGINRTSWKMADLSRVLRETGRPACNDVVRKIIKAAGYKWRTARVVLTSNDPAYSEKLGRIRSILSGLSPDEAFFSIDEYGPFAVKMTYGRALAAPGEHRIVPQWQKPRGSLIVTAALELAKNEITHFYSAKKNTAEMIHMMDVLISRYSDQRKLYLSWDAASWHISKRLYKHVEEHNYNAISTYSPIVETVPLPSGAQFLNVIESVFSGMSRAIIANSDYATVEDAQAAIDRYFDERNAHFRQYPRKAGNRIWGKEREPAAFSAANNCKDPRYR
jgi:transposase